MSQSIQPPNYLANMPNPQQSFVQGLQLGQGVLGIQQEQQSQEQMRQALGELAANPTTENITRTMIQFPSLADKLKEPLKSVTETERTGRISSHMPVYSALASGNPEIARERLLEMATAADNSGRTGEARRFRTLAETARINPGMAMLEIGGVLAANMGPDKFFETFKGVSMLPSDVRRGQAQATTEEATAGAAPIRAGAEAARAVAQARNEASPGLSDAATVRVNEAFTASDAARTRAGQLTELNDKITAAVRDDTTGSLGQLGRGGRRFVELFGGSTEYARLLREFVRLRNAEVVRALPPGPATDRDIQLIASGFPGENGSTEEIQQFLAAASRIAAYEADYNRFRGMFMDANSGSMGRARRSFEIDGVTIPAGADMSSAFRRVITPRIEAQQNMQTLQDDPILSRFVQPPAGQ
jgi:hypothetical protein